MKKTKKGDSVTVTDGNGNILDKGKVESTRTVTYGTLPTTQIATINGVEYSVSNLE